jgi:crotonobetainyl-CoA:carnitine CoA-transferase CaiB-like acyl-CoA transferase
MGNGNPSAGPYGIFATKTAPVAVCCGNDRQFLGLCREFGLGDLASDPRFGSNSARVANRRALEERFAARLSEMTQEEALVLLTTAGVPSGPLRTLEEVLDDELLGPIVTASVGDEEGSDDSRVMALPWAFSRTPAHPWRPAPSLGEHTDELAEILAAAGEGR